jgi:iron complex outermembrane recepter protein
MSFPQSARKAFSLASAISAALATSTAVHADDKSPVLEEIVVTAQKRSENLQDVPIAITALGTEKLDELHIQNLDDYVKYLPAVAYVRGQGQGGNGEPGSSHVYMRGVVSGGDGNHSGSQPSVGTYLDEQPVTTIDGTVDVHVYDIARVEVLEGPQGTLYGASSQSGTIRIITNKPDPTKFSASYDLSVNQVAHGDVGYTAEGYVNLPLSPVAAIRIVGWDEHDGGYISNVAGTNRAAGIINGVRTFPTWSTATGLTLNNLSSVQENYNYVDTAGGRAALRLSLGDNWTITPTFMGQNVKSNGYFAMDPAVGDLEVVHFGPEKTNDSWTQSALTVEGKTGALDVTYAGAYMKRTQQSIADYSDYSYFYDSVNGSGQYWLDHAGNPVMPQQFVVGDNLFEKWSHELRFSTPQNLPVKATFGAFVQRQMHNINQNYVMPGYAYTNPYGGGNPDGLDPALSVPGYPNSIWLTAEQRVDRDNAVFAQASWDITDKLSLTGGFRYFKVDNSLQGFYGYSSVISSHTGVAGCFTNHLLVPNTPCTNLDKDVKESGHVPRVNLTYKFDPTKMVYLTYSEGFRPGGVNRTAVAGIGPYQADYLKNYEAGWKTTWMGRRLQWNGAFFLEDWNNFQFSFLGPNSLTIIENGGNARIKGVESDIQFQATDKLLLSTSFTLLDPRTTTTVCKNTDPNQNPVTDPNCPYTDGNGVAHATGPVFATTGTNLPVSPKFKANAVARYTLDDVQGWTPNLQVTGVYQTQTAPSLLNYQAAAVGMQPAYALFDASMEITKDNAKIGLVITNLLDRRAQLSRFTETNPAVDPQVYFIPAQPRTIAIRFGQKF